MDKSRPLCTPTDVSSLDVVKTFLKPQENEDLLDPEVPYLSIIETLMCLANYTRPDIAFAINFLCKI